MLAKKVESAGELASLMGLWVNRGTEAFKTLLTALQGGGKWHKMAIGSSSPQISFVFLFSFVFLHTPPVA